MSRNLIQQLKELKHQPEAGWVRASEKGAARDALMTAIGHTEASAAPLQTADAFSFFRFNFSHFVSMPATVAASVFVLVLGGWMTSVSAASSLPGDTLYGLKLVSERAQLSLTSLEHKAVLHTEFAERRLEEAVALGTSTDPQKLSYVGPTLDAYTKQLSLAEGNLRQLQEEGHAETIQVASTVDQKIDELNVVIEDLDETDEQAGALDATRQTSNSVIDVVVETHEAAEDQEVSGRDLHALFKDDLQALRSREALDLGRLVVIEQVAYANELEVGSMREVRSSIESAMARVSDAERLEVAGGYRAAFDILREIDVALTSAEVLIAEVEITIVNQLAALQTLEEEAAEGTQQEESTSDSTESENTP